jgi:hypothetical protein
MFQTIRKFFADPDRHVLRDEMTRAVNDGLDLPAAIAAHEQWTRRLDAFLRGDSTEDLRPETVCFDDRCELGKWIHGPGRARLGHLPLFTSLLEDHRQFHFDAAKVVTLTRSRLTDEAARTMAGPYRKHAERVTGALQELIDVTSGSTRSSGEFHRSRKLLERGRAPKAA